MCRIQNAPGAIDECTRRVYDDEVYPVTAAARYTLRMEAASVDRSDPSVQTASVLCVVGCRTDVPPGKEISPA